MTYKLNNPNGSDIVEKYSIKDGYLLFKPFNGGFYKISFNNLMNFFKDIYCPNNQLKYNNIEKVFKTYYVDHVIEQLIKTNSVNKYCIKIDSF